MPRNFQKQIAQLHAFFKIEWHRLLDHLIWSSDEVPHDNRSFGLKFLIKEARNAFSAKGPLYMMS